MQQGRVLARVVTIDRFEKIDGADSIQVVLLKEVAWKAIVKISEFKENDMAVYFEIDTVLPDVDPFSFLKKDGKMKPLRTKIMRGVLSQGLLMPLSCLDYLKIDISSLKPNDDLTELIGCKKYDSIEDIKMIDGLESNGNKPFPTFVPRTDELRVQNCPKVLEHLVESEQEVVITRKEDGTSFTCVYVDQDKENKMFLVCNRNNILPVPKDEKEQKTSLYWEVAVRYDLHKKMEKLGLNCAVQGEITGRKINGGRTGVQLNKLQVFNIWGIDNKQYMCWDDVEKICTSLDLPTVPLLHKGRLPDHLHTVDGLLKYAKSIKYDNGSPAEGIVVKTNCGKEKPRHSFKVISNEYLIKNKI